MMIQILIFTDVVKYIWFRTVEHMFQILVLWKNSVSFPQQLRDVLVWVSYGHFYKQMLYFFILTKPFH
jgi:hypothetical protein